MSQRKGGRNRRKAGRGPKGSRLWWIAGTAVVAVAAALLVALARPEPAVGWEAVEQVLGSPDAPLTVVSYVDFSCPHCGTFALEVGPQLVERYVETGRVRLVYRPMAFLGPGSILAAQVAALVAEQDPELFWRFHDRVFEELHTSGAQHTRERLLALAAEVGADPERIEAGLDANRYRDALGQVRRRAIEEEGVRVTPTVVVGDETIVGAPDPDRFFALIDRMLSETGS